MSGAQEPTPAVRKLLELFNRAGSPPPLHLGTVASARELVDASVNALQAPAADVARVEDLDIPVPHGSVPARVFHPSPGDRLPMVVYLHGGGWTTGDLDTVDRPCRLLASRASVVVVALDYRLSPEAPFPAALDDCTQAWGWLAQHRDDLGADERFIAVVGDSAGGNLAAALVIRTAGGLGPAPDAVALLYPPLEPSIGSPHPSYVENAENPVLPRDTMAWFWSQYVRDDSDYHLPTVCPPRADDLSYFPPTLVVTAGLDVLRDEGRAFAERLRAEGVEVTHREFVGVTHGFLWMDRMIPSALDLVDLVGAFINAGHEKQGIDKAG